MRLNRFLRYFRRMLLKATYPSACLEKNYRGKTFRTGRAMPHPDPFTLSLGSLGLQR